MATRSTPASPAPPASSASVASTAPAQPATHERVYRALRGRIMLGELPPGRALTLRGIAADHRVSMTPAREAVRRLVAEGALTLSSSGSIRARSAARPPARP